MKKIYVVDDQPDIRELLKLTLRADDREILLFDSGEEAIRAALEDPPHLILLDLMMPGGMDGCQAAKILKSEPDTAGCPIILITAMGQQADREKALAAGADDYISKPFDLLATMKKVKAFLG